MFPGRFGVDRHASQVGDLAAQVLLDALGESVCVLDGRRGFQGAMKRDRQFVTSAPDAQVVRLDSELSQLGEAQQGGADAFDFSRVGVVRGAAFCRRARCG